MPAPSPPNKTILELVFTEWLSELPSYYSWRHQCHQNAFVLIFPLSSGREKSHWMHLHWHLSDFAYTLAEFNKKLRHSRDGTPKTHSDNNRRHSEKDSHRSTTTQLWNADMPMSSNHTEVSVHCCQGKHTTASSRTLLSDFVHSTRYWLTPR
jgi:hypothetical protein